MSVINKMLRDLDKQQQQRQRTRALPVLNHSVNHHLLLWAAVPLALLAGWCGQAWYMERFSIQNRTSSHSF